jgi:hypothetical protein
MIPSAGAATPPLDQQFQQSVRPFVTKHCTGCHSGANPAAQFDLSTYSTLDAVTSDYPRWLLVLDRLSAQEIPPKPRSAESKRYVAKKSEKAQVILASCWPAA